MPKRKRAGEKLSLSEQKVLCGYPGCTFNGRPDSFRIHNKRRHGGLQNARVKNSGFEPGARFASYAPVEQTDAGPLQAGEEPDPVGSENMDRAPSASTSGGAGRSEAHVAVDPIAGDSAQDVRHEPGAASDTNALLSKVKDIDSRVKRNGSKLDQVIKILLSISMNGSKKGQSEETRGSETARTLLRSGRSVAALEVATGHHLTASPEVGLLYCSICVPVSCSAADTNTRGVFKYDFGLGDTFKEDQVLPKQFRLLRVSVKNHFCGLHHQKAVTAKQTAEQLAKGRFATNKDAARHVLRTGYYVLKRSLSRASFEDLVVLQHQNGTQVGSLNHSSMFVPTMRLQFSSTMSSMLQKFIARQPCISMCADKVTVAKRTIDITAVVAVVTEAPAGSMIQSFVIAAPVVQDHSGNGLAEELCRSLANVGITHPDKLAAVCMDGQYHHNKVPEKLLHKMSASDPRFETAPSVVVLWDGAHLLNLADEDARRSDRCEWVGQAISSMTRITKRYTIGKGLETLLSAGEERGETVLRPKLWSGTRFAPYASKTLQVFLRNADTMVDVLQQRIRTGEADDSEQRDLRLLRDPKFTTQLAALCDLYDVLAEGSKSLQNLQLLPWERQHMFDNMVCKLAEMQEALENEDTEQMAERWPMLSSHPTTAYDQLPAVLRFTTTLHDKVTERGRGLDARGNSKGAMNSKLQYSVTDIKVVSDLKALQQVRHVDCLEIVHDSIAKLVNQRLIPPTAAVEREVVKAAYMCLSSQPSGMSNQQLLRALQMESAQSHALKQYAHLVIRLWLLSPPESVVESMGSVVGDIFGAHRQLDHRNAEYELMIRWNGPDVHHAEALIQAVQRKFNNNFIRQSVDIRTELQGTVIRRHNSKVCRRSAVFQ